MRYSRQEIIIGKKAQKKLEKSTAAIIGIGALGTVAAEILARAGINLLLVDRDVVEESNLQRQSLFTEYDIGKPKAGAAKYRLEQINRFVKINSMDADVTSANIGKIRADVIIDATDNMETRMLLNDYAMKTKTPLVFGSAVGEKGMVFVVKNNACLRCFLDNKEAVGTCETIGVMGSLTHIIGAMQANEAIKTLSGKKSEEKLVVYSSASNSIEKLSVKKRMCPTHKKQYPSLSKKEKTIVKFCGSGNYQFRTKSPFKEIASTLPKKSKSFAAGKNITIFPDGRVLVKADSEAEARKTFSKYIGG